jgi:hypothetical protein
MGNRVGIWTTATRPANPTAYQTLGYNTTIESHESWNGTGWVRFFDPISTAGDLVIGDGTGQASRLGIGADEQVLTVVDGAPAWAEPAGAASYQMTTAGTVATDLPIGSYFHAANATYKINNTVIPSGTVANYSYESSGVTSVTLAGEVQSFVALAYRQGGAWPYVAAFHSPSSTSFAGGGQYNVSPVIYYSSNPDPRLGWDRSYLPAANNQQVMNVGKIGDRYYWAGNDGTIIHGTSLSTWTKSDLSTAAIYQVVDDASTEAIYIAGYYADSNYRGRIWGWNNASLSHTILYASGENRSFMQAVAVNGNTIVAIMDKYSNETTNILRSGDGGANWSVTQPHGVEKTRPKISFANGKFWFVTNSNIVWSSTDGSSWTNEGTATNYPTQYTNGSFYYSTRLSQYTAYQSNNAYVSQDAINWEIWPLPTPPSGVTHATLIENNDYSILIARGGTQYNGNLQTAIGIAGTSLYISPLVGQEL